MDTFADQFETVFKRQPFPWQSALYERLVVNDIPSVATLPTGLGKTSIIAIWLLARLVNPNLPRRLVYVVNRRTVVDQTTREVERLVENLPKLGRDLSVAVSTLRGQFVDNREWSADPSRPAVICGTVDMIGSRLLFSGYGAGFKTRPMYAGFLGQDALFVHDEAHLEPAFQTVLEHVQETQRADGDPWPIRVMALSATARKAGSGAFSLGAADHANPVVKQRIASTKRLQLQPHGDKDLPALVAEKALSFRESGCAILVFLRTVDDLMKARTLLEKAGVTPCMLAGTMRGHEREQLVKADPVFQRFLPEDDRSKDVAAQEGTVYLLSTSAGEVGVNISADHLVSDLSPFDSMAQRFGRVNRFGDRDDTEVHVFHPVASTLEGSPYESSRAKTLALLETLEGDGSPNALGKLDPEARAAAFTPSPKLLRLDEIVLDAWSLTTIRNLPGRPEVAEYLHGIAEWEPPQTRVAWRDEVELLERSIDDKKRGRQALLRGVVADDLLDDFPLKPHETLSDTTGRIVTTLLAAIDRDETLGQRDVWIVRDAGVTIKTLDEVFLGARRDKKRAETELAGATLLLPARCWEPVGGFLAATWTKSDQGADVASIPGVRVRVRSDDLRTDVGDLRRVRTIQLTEPSEADANDGADDEDAAPPSEQNGRYWIWFESRTKGDTEGSRSGRKAVLLDVHLGDVEREARQMCATLPLKPATKEAIALSGALHDLGKKRTAWQRSIGNRTCPPYLAKSAATQREGENFRYRHELGSLLDARTDPRLAALDEEHRDLVLHLVAAHHGRARPHFPREELFDPEAKGRETEALGTETLRRFARLQRRYGRWGLAYLESLLRAADYAASAAPSQEEP